MKRIEMLAAETRLYDLNIFDWSSVGPRKPITDQNEETALVKVHEMKRNEIIYGFGFEVSHRGGNVPSGTVAVPGLPTINLNGNKIAPSQSTFASPRGSIEFNRRNMRGLGETVSATVLLSQLDQRALATYAQPHFIGSQWSSLTSLSIERTTENPLFAARLGDGCNVPSDVGTLDRKLTVLRQHCLAVGRDSAQVEVTVLDVPVIGRDRDHAASIVEKLRGRTTAAA